MVELVDYLFLFHRLGMHYNYLVKLLYNNQTPKLQKWSQPCPMLDHVLKWNPMQEDPKDLSY